MGSSPRCRCPRCPWHTGRPGPSDLRSSHSYPKQYIRRIKTEDKAKVVASVWGEEFVQCLAALAVLDWSLWSVWRTGWIALLYDDLKEKDKFIIFFKIDLCLCFCIYPSSMPDNHKKQLRFSTLIPQLPLLWIVFALAATKRNFNWSKQLAIL